MKYQITIRYGADRPRYHQMVVEAADLKGALQACRDAFPEELAGGADLVEIRPAVDPEDRTYIE